jgi:hypothetical protein
MYSKLRQWRRRLANEMSPTPLIGRMSLSWRPLANDMPPMSALLPT